MGRRKTKKPKSHGGSGKHTSGSQGARAAEAPAATPAPVPDNNNAGVTEQAGACAANTPPPAATPAQVPPAEPKQRASPKRTLSGSRATMTTAKALQRAQIQGELNSLEAQLAAVEDLQARMAAKLSSVDGNILGMPDGPADTPPPAAASGGCCPMQEKETNSKPKKNKKSKQDKALKQEENLKEAQQLKAAAVIPSPKLEHVMATPGQCEVESWEDIEQVELVLEGNFSGKDTLVKVEAAKKEQTNEAAKREEAVVEPPKIESTEVKVPEKDLKKEDINEKPPKKEHTETEEPKKEEQPIDVVEKTEDEKVEKEQPIEIAEKTGEETFEKEQLFDVVEGTEEEKFEKEQSIDTVEKKEEEKVENGQSMDIVEKKEEEKVEKEQSMDIVEKTEEEEKVEKEVSSDIIKVSPTSEKAQIEIAVSAECKEKDQVVAEKKIIEDLDGEKELKEQLDSILASEIADYLMADYNRMISLRLALDAECHVAMMSSQRTPKTSVSSSDELTPKSVGRYFSYADAVKASLSEECQQSKASTELPDDCHIEEISTEDVDLKLDDLSKEEQSHVYHYMKMEYEPCLRRLEAEEGETIYQEKALSESKSPELPTIEVNLAATPECSDEDVMVEESVKVKVPTSKNADLAIAEALAQDYQQMKMMTDCFNEESRYIELISCQTSATSAAVSCSKLPVVQVEDVKSTDAQDSKIEVARYLKDECDRMQAYQAALISEEDCEARANAEEARHAEAVRKAAVLEAAAMEVEYEGAEEQFLIQREQRRSRPWRWVRADTAPAHIDVPETVPEPISDSECEADTRSTGMVTEMNGLVFQCRDTSTQTESENDVYQQLQEETMQRMALQKYVQILEQEIQDQRQKLADHRKLTNQLENSISDKKAEASEAKMIAAEYKSRCTDLERSLDTARSVVNTLEDQVESSHGIPSAVDYMLEVTKEKGRAAEAQAKIDDLETKLLLSKAEVQKLLDKLSDRNKQLDLMPVVVHQQAMQKTEGIRHELQLKVTQLEAELAQLCNVRDVWGSCQQSTGLQSGLSMGFPVTGVELPPMPSEPPSSCLSGLGLSAPMPDSGTSLTSGLLSGLSDLQTKATPVVAPLALQEDMDSDDDVSWSSASEHLRDPRHRPMLSPRETRNETDQRRPRSNGWDGP